MNSIKGFSLSRLYCLGLFQKFGGASNYTFGSELKNIGGVSCLKIESLVTGILVLHVVHYFEALISFCPNFNSAYDSQWYSVDAYLSFMASSLHIDISKQVPVILTAI